MKNFVDSSEWEIKETMRRGYWTLSYRGRKRLRYVLYEVAISLTGKRAEFREIHEYYRSRKENPLKKMRKLKCMPWLWTGGTKKLGPYRKGRRS
ncbi:hypothetical protein AMURIS_00297 [Acetatifactor muris]|uniref:Uncharacterized protein n=1 Tax=Acetatifactor muris TaxID=879566 RepID=A0A2K4ZAW7_9FIRM|nr:hypothetical protein [Acetatifactor muris]SOY27593.1 hypothetical protein AMURIS_00297 [Acetatifactor muris]